MLVKTQKYVGKNTKVKKKGVTTSFSYVKGNSERGVEEVREIGGVSGGEQHFLPTKNCSSFF